MKKILLFALIIGGALFVASCTKQYNQVVPNQTIIFDLKSSDWGSADGGKNDTVVLKAPQIDKFFNQSGAVLVSLTFDNGATYEPIPYVFDNVNYSYIYTEGAIELFAQSSDGTAVIPIPPASSAKVTFVPADLN